MRAYSPGRAFLFCFLLYAQPGAAHLPELFGREYIRLDDHGNKHAALSNAAEPSLPSNDDEAQYKNELRNAEISGGPYATGLSDPYIGMAYYFLKRGDSSGALEAYRKALHLVRINDGLNSPRQVPILREIIDIYRRAGDARSLDNTYQYYARVLQFDKPPLTEEKVQVALEYMGWERGLYATQSVENTRAPLMRAHRANESLLKALVPQTPQEKNWYIRLTLSQMRNLYLVLGDEYLPMKSTAFATGNGAAIDAVNRRFAFVQQGALRKGRQLLQGAIDYIQTSSGTDRAKLHLELGDWHQWNGELGRAREQYSQVVELLNASGDQGLLLEWLGQPVELPDEADLHAADLSLSLSPSAGVVIEARYDVTPRGDVQRVEVSTGDKKNEWQAWRLKRMLRETHFRPRFSHGEAELAEQVSRRYMLVGIH